MSGKRKRQSVLPGIAAVALLAAALWALLANVVFVVRDVQVIGAGEIPEAEVRHLSGIQLGTRINGLNEERIRLDVESDGRLAFVSLETRLPNRVVLTVRLRTMDAVILQAGKILVLDSDGYVVRVTNTVPEGVIPYVTGIKASYYTLGRQLDTGDGRCMAMKAVVEALKAQNAAGYVAELSVANTEDLRIVTRTNVTVLLGNAEDMPAKIAWMSGALADLQSRGQTGGVLDVSSATKADYKPPEQEAPAAWETAEAAPAETVAPAS